MEGPAAELAGLGLAATPSMLRLYTLVKTCVPTFSMRWRTACGVRGLLAMSHAFTGSVLSPMCVAIIIALNKLAGRCCGHQQSVLSDNKQKQACALQCRHCRVQMRGTKSRGLTAC